MSIKQPNTERLLSATEQAVATALTTALPDNFTVEHTPQKIDVSAGGQAGFSYMPDFLIKDQESGKKFAVEVKPHAALSFANESNFKFINSAYKEQGDDFVVLVVGIDSAEPGRIERLRNEGIQAIGGKGSAEAAIGLGELLKQSRDQTK